jgi:hypothetical protein
MADIVSYRIVHVATQRTIDIDIEAETQLKRKKRRGKNAFDTIKVRAKADDDNQQRPGSSFGVMEDQELIRP